MLIHGNWSINKRYLTLRNRASKEKKDAYIIGAVVGEQPWIRVFRTALVWRFEDNHWMWTLRLPRTLRKNSPLDRYKRSCKQLKLKIYDESKTLSRILFDVSSTIFTKPSFEHYKQSNITVSVRYSGACSVPGVVNRMKSVGLLFDWFGSQT